MKATQLLMVGHIDLMRAALEGQTETVEALLEHAPYVNARDSEGRTALMFPTVNLHTDSAAKWADPRLDRIS